MRLEELEKATPVIYTYGGVIYHMSDFSIDHEPRIELELKTQERMAIDNIRSMQNNAVDKKDGYYISRAVVYKVSCSNNQVIKIVGDEAKGIKRLVKKASDFVPA
jgi:hypothetical protein